MIQEFWLIDFFGIFLGRTLIAIGILLKSIELLKQSGVAVKKDASVRQLSIWNNLPITTTKEKTKQKKPVGIKKTEIISKKKIIEGWFYFFSALLIFIGFYSAIVSAFWVIYLALKLQKEKSMENVYLLALFIFLLLIGPGQLSLDRIFDVRL